MLNIGLLVLISIDFLLLFIGNIIFYLHAFKVFSFKDFIMKIQATVPEKLKHTAIEQVPIEENQIFKENKKTFSQCVSSGFKKSSNFVVKLFMLTILIAFLSPIIIICIAFPTASVWGTILIAVYFDVFYAIVFLFAIRLINFALGLMLLKFAKVDKIRTQRVLIMDAIQFSMLALLVYIAAFGYPLNVYNMVVIPFKWEIELNNLLSIAIPMIFYALVITNVFALFIRFKNILTKDVNKHQVIRLHQLLFIFIASCFFGILYITDIDLGFMSDLERTMYLQTLEVVKWIITSAFIPLFLFTLNNFRRSNSLAKPDSEEAI